MQRELQRRHHESDAAYGQRLRRGLGSGSRLSCRSSGALRQALHSDGKFVSFIVALTEGASTLVDTGADWTEAELDRYLREHEGDGFARRDVDDEVARETLCFCGPCLLPAAHAAARLRPMTHRLAPGDILALPFWQRHAGPAAADRDVWFLTWSPSAGAAYSDAAHQMPWSLALRAGAFNLAAERVADHPGHPLHFEDENLVRSLKEAAAAHIAFERACAVYDTMRLARAPGDSAAGAGVSRSRADMCVAEASREAAVTALRAMYAPEDEATVVEDAPLSKRRRRA